MLSSLTRFLAFVFVLVFCAPVLAAPDYVATVPCPGPKPASDPTLNPNDPIVRLKGAADTLEFEVRPANGVNLTISNWKINGDLIFNAQANMTQAGSDWGVFVPTNGMKTLKWTLGGTKDGSFKLTAVLKRSCGGGVNGGGNGEIPDEDLDLWGGDVLSIESLSWEATAESPLDDNPTDMGSGKRIFPDKTTPTDTTVRNTVRVKAQLNKPKAGIAVHFKAFDVDDPTANAAPLDNDANGADGGDNRGTGAGGSLAAAQANTVVQNGVATATVTFTVSMQPGNNFRVAVALDVANLTPLTTDQVPNGANEQYIPASNAQVEKFNGKMTDLLTVWRRLHVEVDSMGAVAGNTVTGQIQQVDQGDNNTAICTTDTKLADSIDRFSPGKMPDRLTLRYGKLKDQNNQEFEVLSNTKGDRFTVTVKSKTVDQGGQMVEISPAIGDFSLIDDDHLLDGDNIPELKTSFLTERFKPAFIEVVFDGGGNIANNAGAPFRANIGKFKFSQFGNPVDETDPNTPDLTIDELETEAKKSRNSTSSATFWTTHCISAFQSAKFEDYDPDTEHGPLGISNWKSAFVFNETSYDKGYTTDSHLGHTLVHEVGHAFRLADEYGRDYAPYNNADYNGIMRKVTRGIFTDENLAAIRSIDYPSK